MGAGAGCNVEAEHRELPPTCKGGVKLHGQWYTYTYVLVTFETMKVDV